MNTTIKIAITNLGKYNEGELVFTWLELPATDEEISEAFAEIGVAPNTDYEEHFISDYEAPFSISEHASISALNEKAEILDSIDGIETILDGTYDAGDVINFAHELEREGHLMDAFEHIGDIVDDEQLDERVASLAQEGGWQRVAHFLAGITFMNDDYYWINGYANAENLDKGRLEGIVSDLLDEIDLNLDEN